MTRDFDFDRFDIRSVAFCSRHNEDIDITGGREAFVNVPRARHGRQRSGRHHTFRVTFFYDHDDDDAVTISSPQIVENVASICRGGERVIRIRLPRHLTVELSDIFVLNNCARREVHDDYT